MRYIENQLGLAVWIPVDIQLYLQLEKAVRVAVDSLHSATQREATMKLTTSKGDALQRVNAMLPHVPFPSDVTRGCRTALVALMGEELALNQWQRLTPQMQEWLAKVRRGCVRRRPGVSVPPKLPRASRPPLSSLPSLEPRAPPLSSLPSLEPRAPPLSSLPSSSPPARAVPRAQRRSRRRHVDRAAATPLTPSRLHCRSFSCCRSRRGAPRAAA